MKLPSIISKQKSFNRRIKIGNYMLIVLGKSTDEEHLSQPLPTNIKKFKSAVTF